MGGLADELLARARELNPGIEIQLTNEQIRALDTYEAAQNAGALGVLMEMLERYSDLSADEVVARIRHFTEENLREGGFIP